MSDSPPENPGPTDVTAWWDGGYAPRSQRAGAPGPQNPFRGGNYDYTLLQLQVWFLAAMVVFFCVVPATWRQQVVAFLGARCGCGADAAAPEPTEAPKPTEATPLLERDVESVAAATEPKAPPPARPKLYYVDHLRVLLIVLVVCTHCANVFLERANNPRFPFGETTNIWEMAGRQFYSHKRIFSVNVILETFNGLNTIYFMALFFFISGIFTPRSFERKGWTKFLEDRMLRIALPCVVWYFLLGPLLMFVVIPWSFPHRGKEYRLRTGAPWNLDSGPVWFLKSLAFYNITYACTPRALSSTVRCPPAGALLLGGLVLGLFNTVLPGNGIYALNGVMGLRIEVSYITFFIAGCAAGRGAWLESIASYSAGTVAFLRGVVMLYCVVYFFFRKALWSELVRTDNGDSGASSPLNEQLWPLLTGFSGVFAVAMSLSLLQGFHQYCNTSNALTRALSSAAYTVYLIHPFAIAFAVWTLFKIYKAEGYDISQKMDLDLGTLGYPTQEYVPDATWPGTYWVNSAWDDDNERVYPGQNALGIGRLWGYKSWGGWLWLCFISNVVVWPVAYAIKQLPGVRSVM